ncbi:hypothetical protein BG006_006282 [Podila minutissima]|uniref:Uncharacterized protein n=1 Tax=Podila minutissima TaxID=64525 RepID=A0A9P5SSU3_9FUNG|nr:hypothetical protein BG006_006282 [Podila minutissima]
MVKSITFVMVALATVAASALDFSDNCHGSGRCNKDYPSLTGRQIKDLFKPIYEGQGCKSCGSHAFNGGKKHKEYFVFEEIGECTVKESVRIHVYSMKEDIAKWQIAIQDHLRGSKYSAPCSESISGNGTLVKIRFATGPVDETVSQLAKECRLQRSEVVVCHQVRSRTLSAFINLLEKVIQELYATRQEDIQCLGCGKSMTREILKWIDFLSELYETVITDITSVTIPQINTLRFRSINFDSISPHSCSSGILADSEGRVQALWLSYLGHHDKCSGSDTAYHLGLAISTILPVLRPLHQDLYPQLRSLNIELTPVLMSKARDMGFSDAWDQRVEAANPAHHHVYKVRRTETGSLSSTILEELDLILSINGKVITRIQELDVQYEAESLEMVVLRNKEELMPTVPTELVDENETGRVVTWAGAMIQALHKAVLQQRKQAPSRVPTSEMVKDDSQECGWRTVEYTPLERASSSSSVDTIEQELGVQNESQDKLVEKLDILEARTKL